MMVARYTSRLLKLWKHMNLTGTHSNTGTPMLLNVFVNIQSCCHPHRRWKFINNYKYEQLRKLCRPWCWKIAAWTCCSGHGRQNCMARINCNANGERVSNVRGGRQKCKTKLNTGAHFIFISLTWVFQPCYSGIDRIGVDRYWCCHYCCCEA